MHSLLQLVIAFASYRLLTSTLGNYLKEPRSVMDHAILNVGCRRYTRNPIYLINCLVYICNNLEHNRKSIKLGKC